jgi:hypothetical protein
MGGQGRLVKNEERQQKENEETSLAKYLELEAHDIM